MKKQTKKLVLTRETVANLDLRTGRVAGGTTSTNECPYTFDLTCDCGYSTGMQTCLCNSNQVACPITAGETCLAC